MFDEIRNHPDLADFRCRTCEENNVAVKVCDELTDNGELRQDLIDILKIDAYYNNRVHQPDPSIDCLIVIKTGHREFGLTLVELKNVSHRRHLGIHRIGKKFKTTIQDFLSNRFADIFTSIDFTLSYFRLWLVTNPGILPPMPSEKHRKRFKTSELERCLIEKPHNFRGNVAHIECVPPGQQVC